MIVLAMLAFAFHGAALLVDEFFYRRRREPTRWERLGHPLDTLTLLLCYAIVLTSPATVQSRALFGAAGVVSCLFLAKDDFVQVPRRGSKAEQWFRTLLFILHPVSLAFVAWLWHRREASLLGVQAFLAMLLGVYQFVYWNITWKKPHSPP